MNRIKKLKERKKVLLEDLYDLYHGEPSRKVYQQKRSEIEYEIACIEEAIEIEEKMAPFKWMLYGFIVIAIGMLIWAYAVSK